MNRDKVFGSFLAISVFLLLVLLIFWIYQNYEIQIQKLKEKQDKLKVADDIVNKLVTAKEKGPVVEPPTCEPKKEEPVAPCEPNTKDNSTQDYPKIFEKICNELKNNNKVSTQYVNDLNQKIIEQNKLAEELNKKAAEVNKKYY